MLIYWLFYTLNFNWEWMMDSSISSRMGVVEIILISIIKELSKIQ
jgi:hypothetical protein